MGVREALESRSCVKVVGCRGFVALNLVDLIQPQLINHVEVLNTKAKFPSLSSIQTTRKSSVPLPPKHSAGTPFYDRYGGVFYLFIYFCFAWDNMMR